MINSNNILENSDLFDIINKSIKNKIPSSFIRKGDGENIVIGYNRLKEIDYKQYKRIMRHMNVKLKNRSLQQFIIDELFSAFNNCNVLGISKIEQRYNFWAIENNVLELLNFVSNQYCDMNFHMDFVKYPRENKIRTEVAREIISNKNLGISRYLPQKEPNINFPIYDLSQKKPIQPSAKEVAKNVRARSAKLRYAVRNENNIKNFNFFTKKFSNYIEIEKLKL